MNAAQQGAYTGTGHKGNGPKLKADWSAPLSLINSNNIIG